MTASVIITPKPGSDFRENRKKLEGMEKIIQFAVGGLSKENIVITDQNGIQLNDFADLRDIDRIEIARREIKTKAELEQRYKTEVYASLRQIWGQDRVQIVKLDIDLDMSKRSSTTEEHFPVTMVPDNPRTPYSEREVVPSITLSREAVDERFEGTGFNPEGPPGQEGQTPPAYKDLSNLVGKYQKSSIIQNEAVNTKNTTEEQAPWRINRVTAAVALDGIWKQKLDARGQPVLSARRRHHPRVRAGPAGGAAEGPLPGAGRHRLQPRPGGLGHRRAHPVRPQRAVHEGGRAAAPRAAGAHHRPVGRAGGGGRALRGADRTG